MKKKVFLLALALCCVSALFAQNVLPGYSGYWELSRRIGILDLVEFYPDKLPYIRNEIYARYGRPFVNKTYQDYFRAKSWYQEKSNFTENWLTQTDKENADFIASVEREAKSIDQVTAQVLKNIEYKGNQTVLTFTSRQYLVWSDPAVGFGPYGLNSSGESPWAAMGDWILVYDYRSYVDMFTVVAYKVDHVTKRIITSVIADMKYGNLIILLNAQGRATPSLR